jgi:hypothetical protein
MLGLLAVMAIGGCQGQKVAKNGLGSGPQVDVSVEPMRVGDGKAEPVPSRAQRMAQAPYSLESTPAQSSEEVQTPRRSDEEEERPRKRRRKRVRHAEEESQEQTSEKRETRRRTEDSQRPQPKKEKNFDDLSAEERRKLIEGG